MTWFEQAQFCNDVGIFRFIRWCGRNHHESHVKSHFSQKRLSCPNIKSVFRHTQKRSVTVTLVTYRTHISTHPRNVRQGSTMACLGWWMVQATTWPARARARILSITQRAWEVVVFPSFTSEKVIFEVTLQGINISHLGKRKIIFKMPFLGDMLVPWRVFEVSGQIGNLLRYSGVNMTQIFEVSPH